MNRIQEEIQGIRDAVGEWKQEVILQIKSINREEWCCQSLGGAIEYHEKGINISQQEGEKVLLAFFKGGSFRQLKEVLRNEKYKNACYELKWGGEVSGSVNVQLGMTKHYKESKNSTRLHPFKQAVKWANEDFTALSLFLMIEGSGSFTLDCITVSATTVVNRNQLEIEVEETRKRIQQIEEIVQGTAKIVIPRNSIKVATILDEFSFNCLKYELDLFQLGIKEWRTQLEEEAPEFLLVESAWYGINKEWQGEIARYQQGCSEEVKKILKFCKKRNIPSVFWNKEGASNWDYFWGASSLFDYVFITDENILERQKGICNHNNVYILPFAAQPLLHNAVNKNAYQLGEVAFSGSWYGDKHPKRLEDIETILEPALLFNVSIYDRNFEMRENLLSVNLYWPTLYWKNIIGQVPYDVMVQIYKYYKVFLNVNSIHDSENMIARRVYEILMAKTAVLTSYSKALEKGLKEYVYTAQTKQETISILKELQENKMARIRKSKKAQRYIIENHTYRQRVTYLLECIGIKQEKVQPIKVVIILRVTNLKNDFWIENCIQEQSYPISHIICLSEQEKRQDVKNILQNMKISYTVYSREDYDCRNAVEEEISKFGEVYLAIFEDNYFYGKHYLRDYVNALTYVPEGIIGKNSVFGYDKNKGVLVKINSDMEDCYCQKLIVSTLFMKAHYKNIVLDYFFKVFKYGECNMYDMIEGGEKPLFYAEDAFNYCYIGDTLSFCEIIAVTKEPRRIIEV